MSAAIPTHLRHPLPARPIQGCRPPPWRALSGAADVFSPSRRNSLSSAMGATPVVVTPNPGMTPLRRLGKLADLVLDKGRIENLQLVNALRQPLAQASIFGLLEDDVCHRSAAVENLRQWSGEALREVLALEEMLLSHALTPAALKQQKLQPSRPALCGLVAAALHLCGRAGGRAVVEASLRLIEPAMAPEERCRMLLLALASALGDMAAGEGAQVARLAPAGLKRRHGALNRELRRASAGQARRLRKQLVQEVGRALTWGVSDRLQLPLSGQFERVERDDSFAEDDDFVAVQPWGQNGAHAPGCVVRPQGLTGYLGRLWGGARADAALATTNAD